MESTKKVQICTHCVLVTYVSKYRALQIAVCDILDFHLKSTGLMVVDSALKFRNSKLKNVFE